ncbi:MAG: DUF5615 family PIN-like protein [Chloroflexota bacterium]|nr:DUF5615 family PIN-like protein [Chloroflexota bacterium]
MIIKVDEDLPNLAVEALIEHGYPAKGVYEQGMSGWKDHQLWQAIQDDLNLLVGAITVVTPRGVRVRHQ